MAMLVREGGSRWDIWLSLTVKAHADMDGHCKATQRLESKEDCGTWGRLPCLPVSWVEVQDAIRPETYTTG